MTLARNRVAEGSKTHSTLAPKGSNPSDSAVDVTGVEHLAVIMDGNGRWARSLGMARTRGHRAGVDSVRDIVTECARAHLRYLTLFALSTENFRCRPAHEVRTLMSLLRRFMIEERSLIMENDVRLRTIGHVTELPRKVVLEIRKTEALSQNNRGTVLTLALNYGGRAEICDAARKIAERVLEGTLRVDEIQESTVAGSLYDATLPDVDLLVRTAGEVRISNFLLWQLSYAEIFVTQKCWPEFRRSELEVALQSFRRRSRRFGGLIEREPR